MASSSKMVSNLRQSNLIESNLIEPNLIDKTEGMNPTDGEAAVADNAKSISVVNSSEDPSDGTTAEAVRPSDISTIARLFQAVANSEISLKGLRDASPANRWRFFCKSFDACNLIYLTKLPAIFEIVKYDPTIYNEAIAAYSEVCTFYASWHQEEVLEEMIPFEMVRKLVIEFDYSSWTWDENKRLVGVKEPSECVEEFLAGAVNVVDLKLVFPAPGIRGVGCETEPSIFEKITMCLAKSKNLKKLTVEMSLEKYPKGYFGKYGYEGDAYFEELSGSKYRRDRCYTIALPWNQGPRIDLESGEAESEEEELFDGFSQAGYDEHAGVEVGVGAHGFDEQSFADPKFGDNGAGAVGFSEQGDTKAPLRTCTPLENFLKVRVTVGQYLLGKMNSTRDKLSQLLHADPEIKTARGGTSTYSVIESSSGPGGGGGGAGGGKAGVAVSQNLLGRMDSTLDKLSQPLDADPEQEKIKTCPKIKGNCNFMHKTKDGEVEAVCFENYPSLVQLDPENARELARIPQWSNEELLKGHERHSLAPPVKAAKGGASTCSVIESSSGGSGDDGGGGLQVFGKSALRVVNPDPVEEDPTDPIDDPEDYYPIAITAVDQALGFPGQFTAEMEFYHFKSVWEASPDQTLAWTPENVRVQWRTFANGF